MSMCYLFSLTSWFRALVYGIRDLVQLHSSFTEETEKPPKHYLFIEIIQEVAQPSRISSHKWPNHFNSMHNENAFLEVMALHITQVKSFQNQPHQAVWWGPVQAKTKPLQPGLAPLNRDINSVRDQNSQRIPQISRAVEKKKGKQVLEGKITNIQRVPFFIL